MLTSYHPGQDNDRQTGDVVFTGLGQVFAALGDSGWYQPGDTTKFPASSIPSDIKLVVRNNKVVYQG